MTQPNKPVSQRAEHSPELLAVEREALDLMREAARQDGVKITEWISTRMREAAERAIRPAETIASTPSQSDVIEKCGEDALRQIILVVEEEVYKVTEGQKPCKHTAALNEVHEIASAALVAEKDQQ